MNAASKLSIMIDNAYSLASVSKPVEVVEFNSRYLVQFKGQALIEGQDKKVGNTAQRLPLDVKSKNLL